MAFSGIDSHNPDARHAPPGLPASLIICQCLMLLAIGLFSVTGPGLNTRLSDIASVQDSVCRELLSNTTAGRQALVSSAWWPPLPLLLRLPLVATLPADCTPLPSLFISMLFGVCSAALTERTLNLWKLGWQRFLVVGAVCCTPSFLHECLNGSNATTILFLTLFTTCSMIQWLTQHRLRDLIYLSVGSAMISISSLEMWPWLALLFLLLAMDQSACRTEPEKKQAVLILGMITPLYSIGVWSLVNWLAMGDALYFLRSLITAVTTPAAPRLEHMTPLHIGSAGILAASAIAAIIARDRAGFFLASLGTGLVTLTLLLAAFGLLWNSTPFLVTLFPVSAVALAYLTSRLRHPPAAKTALCLVPLIILLFHSSTLPLFPSSILSSRRGNGPTGAKPDPTFQSSRLPALISRRILTESDNPVVFVCGYDGFLLDFNTEPEKKQKNPLFVHSLDFNFNDIKTNYAGNDLYLMVHQPSDRSRMNSIHWKYPDLFEFGGNSALHHSDWDNWRLFEIIQAPPSSP